ncbi:MAG: hypothetical protein ACOY82_05235 [Pseudomonadota bacterium]
MKRFTLAMVLSIALAACTSGPRAEALAALQRAAPALLLAAPATGH